MLIKKEIWPGDVRVEQRCYESHGWQCCTNAQEQGCEFLAKLKGKNANKVWIWHWILNEKIIWVRDITDHFMKWKSQIILVQEQKETIQSSHNICLSYLMNLSISVWIILPFISVTVLKHPCCLVFTITLHCSFGFLMLLMFSDYYALLCLSKHLVNSVFKDARQI